MVAESRVEFSDKLRKTEVFVEYRQRDLDLLQQQSVVFEDGAKLVTAPHCRQPLSNPESHSFKESVFLLHLRDGGIAVNVSVLPPDFYQISALLRNSENQSVAVEVCVLLSDERLEGGKCSFDYFYEDCDVFGQLGSVLFCHQNTTFVLYLIARCDGGYRSSRLPPKALALTMLQMQVLTVNLWTAVSRLLHLVRLTLLLR